MRKKTVAIIVIHIIAIAFAAYNYSITSTYEIPNSSLTATPLPTPTLTSTPSPTSTQASTNTLYPIRLSFIEWDPHSLPFPTQIYIIYPEENDNYTTSVGELYFRVGFSSNKWIINGVFYTADWISGPQPIWYYNLGTCVNALCATISFTGLHIGNHTIAVHMNLHDGSYFTKSITFTVTPRNST